MNWDYNLFLWLNFDGGLFMDFVMIFASSRIGWLPLYLVVLYICGRKVGWRRILLLLGVLFGAASLANITAGMFNNVGLLSGLCPESIMRLRPMYVDGFLGEHVRTLLPHSQYVTVSAVVAVATSLAIIAALVADKWWITVALSIQVLLVCYSRIYLACNFPQDILLGIIVGLLSAVVVMFIGRRIERFLPPIGTK